MAVVSFYDLQLPDTKAKVNFYYKPSAVLILPHINIGFSTFYTSN